MIQSTHCMMLSSFFFLWMYNVTCCESQHRKKTGKVHNYVGLDSKDTRMTGSWMESLMMTLRTLLTIVALTVVNKHIKICEKRGQAVGLSKPAMATFYPGTNESIPSLRTAQKFIGVLLSSLQVIYNHRFTSKWPLSPFIVSSPRCSHLFN